MKAATAKQIKDELKGRPPKDLLELCLRLSRFKKENKELLTYLLFEAESESNYIENVVIQMDEQFAQINSQNYYYIKKGTRKILKGIKKYIRYSGNKETEVELLLAFCRSYKRAVPAANKRLVLKNIMDRQVALVKKKIALLHEDLQYDYGLELDSILSP